MKLNKKKKIVIFSVIAVLILALLVSYKFLVDKKEYQEITYNEFLNSIENREVSKVFYNENPKIKGMLKDGTYFVTDNPRTENFKEKMLISGVDVVETEGNTTFKDILFFIFFLAGFGGVVYFMNKNSSRMAQKEITEMAAIDNANDNSGVVTFEDIAGNEEAKESLKELVDFIKNPQKYERYGARIPRGVLLYGPPGTGKTLLAKALAGEANVPFFAVTGSDFIQVYAGLGASRIRSLFKKARQAGKCVIFIDEIDALGKKRRGGLTGGNDESDRTLNALLTEMSGFKGDEGIIVVAATNRIDTLDEALLRPGRFDRQLEVGLPDVNARHKILKLHSRNKPLDKDVDLRKVAYQTVYFSGAKLENLMNESAMLAAKNNENTISMKHIDKAFYTVVAGEEKKDRSSISIEDKKVTAYHEAGHALITKLVSPKNRVTKVTIIPSTKGAGGFSMNIPPDRMYQTKGDIKNSIMIALGGRLAEELIFGKDNITTGASNDLEKATNMAISMISRFGMDTEAGLISYAAVLGNNVGANNYVLDRTKKLISNLYEETKKLMIQNKDLLEEIANKLLEKETLNEEEIYNIINKKVSLA
ncbi:ATP-dependent zinc metalloprotease FtsH [Caldisalinibacter kiritimatiensis]|uniref:ATP-dependent zinc metalloprotease FtsH n=1 Tax=Caldisalinibacter kiritimatiensis TaxID=1304284 RepID=R1CYJ3_9FIRM|nr:ATP-dependent zinc metalloprotease FtsH [Caldisalinibacter kiritimatiensis]EOD01649.1 Cell division protein FtsH [Caldisalinibacter kiritimatiensis]